MKRMFAVAVVLVALFSGAAWASSISLDLTVPNTALEPYTPPFATVSITVPTGGAYADIIFAAEPGYRMGTDAAADLNTSVGVTVSDITWVGGDLVTHFTVAGDGNADGFGRFNLRLNNFDGYTASVHSLSFRITPVSGTFADAASVLVDNPKGYLAAAHIFVEGPNGALATGYVANGGVTPPQELTPEPATFLLLGGALLLGGGIYRRRFVR